MDQDVVSIFCWMDMYDTLIQIDTYSSSSL